ncbi:hydantoinase/oxoprolinase family protein [Thermogemmatispora sp.]|uniref:hydantoinase/oxoprolinase family protein n=1 Tax=Thermogemmatispora sp. TaxID=1968838 RepID=UPI001D577DDB|nr:hydantoinase/oxoprolinase family protein [Thermogemmatispora sp.]MBX5448726.1 hydantoinase/oxoprolinase family protein [Thermogemmatispora sp.]
MLAVDVGGTFTDVVALTDHTIKVTKVPTNTLETERSVLEGARLLDVARKPIFNHASTVGLNAIITRRLPKVAFLTTLGHRDILDMGRTWRPLDALTDPGWRRPFGDAAAPLVPRYLRRGISERITADGSVLIPLDEAQAREQLAILRKCHVQGVAICLLNAYVNPQHEIRLRELVREELGDIPCSISSEVSPLAKEYARASTTLIDVLMKIIFSQYSHNLLSGLREAGFAGQVNFADCAAMLRPAEIAMEQPFRIVFAGPAAGAVSSAHFGRLIGEENLICCDIGGTSCDISVVTRGQPVVNETFELEHDLLVNALSIEIASIGAGGGSIVSISPSGEMRVGPESAGADPGPACYGKGGTAPTLTDTCLLIGILDPERFLGGQMRLDVDLARAAFERLPTSLSLEKRIEYAYKIGLNNIAEGLLDITIKQGIDPRDYSLIAYGAAGPLFLPAILEQIKAKRVIVPPYPGFFSALGLLSSDLVYSDSRSAYMVLTPEVAPTIAQIYHAMEEKLLARIPGDKSQVRILRSFDGRLLGQTWETPFVEVPAGEITAETIATMIENFHRVYEQRSGNRFEAIPVQSVTYRVQVVVPSQKVEYPFLGEGQPHEVAPEHWTTLRYLGNGELRVAEYERAHLTSGAIVRGPAIIREPTSTIHVVAGQVARVGSWGEVIIEPVAS